MTDEYWVEALKVIAVVNRYFRALDEKHFDESHFRQIFTSEARVVRPDDTSTVGPLAIAESHVRNFSRFEASQHLLAGHDVAIDGESASLRANLVAIHLWKDRHDITSMSDRSFTAGGVVSADLRRTPAGWLIDEIANRVIWRTGFFGDMPPAS